MKRLLLTMLLVSSMAAWSGQAVAGVVITVGTQVATDGDILTFPGAGAGSWNGAVGSSLLADPTLDVTNGVSGSDFDPGTSYNGSWTFNYAPFVEPLASATLTFGIIDHDSAAAGDQVASFTVDGVDLTAELNTAFNASGGRVFPTIPPFFSEYNVYSLNLTGGALAGLADGTAVVNLRLQNGFGGGPTLNNGAAVDFSRLSITAVPEPGSLILLSVCLPMLVRRRRLA